MTSVSSSRRRTTVALLGAVGVALFVVESYIPMPLPFLKIGLANISGVIALMLLGVSSMFAVVALRVILGSFLVGTFMSPAFVLAISAGLLSSAAMAAVYSARHDLFSAFGLSLIGSVVHVIIQLMIVRFVYAQNAAVLFLLPLLLLTALAGGVTVGWISLRLLNSLKQIRL